MKKNDTCIITVHGYTAEGMGVGRTHEGMAVFVPGAARGDKLEVLLVKVLKNYAFGKILNILEPSPHRVEADCPHFGKCGGCDFRHLTYEEELWLKARRVHDAMTRIGGFDLPVPDITGSPDIDRYRNKGQFPVGTGETGTVYGFFRSRSHQLIPLTDCKLQSEESCALAAAVCRWADRYQVRPYDESKHAGILRHIYVRQGRAGLHLTLVVRKDGLPEEEALTALCREAVPALCGIVVNVNPDPGNRVLGRTCRTLWGDGRLEDDLAGNTYRLSPLSFYQVNRAQTENLYACAAAWAAPDRNTEALDLYCGVGTITLTLAGRCKTVMGVEIVPAAIEDARENAARNGIENARFLCADAGTAASRLAAEGFRPGVIVVDPPRKGLDQPAVDALCRMGPERIVYVSCDCASLARDAKMLFEQGGYRPVKVQAFDMFPRTANVETVALLEKAEG
ncbi:MAG: 23S rRNA (uracil(1939)-C(5))-methyltransferase RlmD [Clostridia bacterium]|nr:23S rRNA (uracil(1939)-C(5))-methyltransferase RlmD [Clostridia bacterium]